MTNAVRATKPIIGISGRRFSAAKIFPADAEMMRDLVIDGYFRAYAEKIAQAGGIPVYLPSGMDVESLIGTIDGLVLSGGQDLDPSLYGRQPSPTVHAFDPEQDRFDIALTLRACDAGVPVLGCCRGVQVINVAFGGTLIEDLPAQNILGHNVRDYPPSARRHEVEVLDGSRLRSIYGESTRVNTFHHQAAERIGDGLTVTAVAPGGIAEGLEHSSRPIVGVQWHPELHEGVDPVISWLVAAAAHEKRARTRAEHDLEDRETEDEGATA